MFCCTDKRLLSTIVIGFLVVIGLAYIYHWQLILAYSPFLFMLLCPLMHLFMGGHGGRAGGKQAAEDGKKRRSCH